jgi:hypothetical protein
MCFEWWVGEGVMKNINISYMCKNLEIIHIVICWYNDFQKPSTGKTTFANHPPENDFTQNMFFQ